MLAEGAIHVILRSVQPAVISERWSGRYNNEYPITLQILRRSGGEFTGQMTYPSSGTVTRIAGQIRAEARNGEPVIMTWKETEFVNKGNRRIDLDGHYEASISGNAMTGRWYYENSRRVVAEFNMEASTN